MPNYADVIANVHKRPEPIQQQEHPTQQHPIQQHPVQPLPMQQLPMQQLPMRQLPMQQLPTQPLQMQQPLNDLNEVNQKLPRFLQSNLERDVLIIFVLFGLLSNNSIQKHIGKIIKFDTPVNNKILLSNGVLVALSFYVIKKYMLH
jgi:hypothetical protein